MSWYYYMYTERRGMHIKEMTNQMREAFNEATKALFDTASEWEQQAIDTLKADIRGIKELEHEHSE